MSADPGTVYNPFVFDATDHQLQRMLMTGVVVAGKVARQQQDKLDQFEVLLWRRAEKAATVFNAMLQVANMDGWSGVEDMLRKVKMGQYTRVIAAFRGMVEAKLDLRTCSRDDLVKIPGIGLKTASFFIMFTRRNANIACLDTHILAYMREHNMHPQVPRSTPPPKLYLELEKVWLFHCKEINRDPAELDFEIWLARNHGDRAAAAPR